jgi:hypothetical protein
MTLIHPHSLAATLDGVEEAFFAKRPLPAAQRQRVAEWIAGRQGLPGSYAGMFAPAGGDWNGTTVFTGERIVSRAAVSHVLGEEACRTLILLGKRWAGVRQALTLATRGMMSRLRPPNVKPTAIGGMYCCGICSVALWRHLVVGGLSEPERRLAAGMKALKVHRKGGGQWRRFPFWYTLLALGEIRAPGARTEMRYAVPVCEQYLERAPRDGKYTQRRRLVAKQVLEKC